jgi:hypothetical protein
VLQVSTPWSPDSLGFVYASRTGVKYVPLFPQRLSPPGTTSTAAAAEVEAEATRGKSETGANVESPSLEWRADSANEEESMYDSTSSAYQADAWECPG